MTSTTRCQDEIEQLKKWQKAGMKVVCIDTVIRAIENIQTNGLEEICICGHKYGWHHAKMKYQGKDRICFGIACMCEVFQHD